MRERHSPSLRGRRESGQIAEEEGRRKSSSFDEKFPAFGKGLSIPVEVSEKDEMVLVRVELPGLDPKDIDIQVKQGQLRISGEKKETTSSEKEKIHYREVRYGSFYRSIPLPARVDDDQAKARFKDGVLTVELPKSPEAQPRKITVS